MCWWATSWAVYSLDDGHFSPIGDSFTVLWLVLIVLGGTFTAFRGYRAEDEASRLITALGVLLAGLLFVVAIKEPEGFLEVQIGIIASLILALAGTKATKPRKRRRPGTAQAKP